MRAVLPIFVFLLLAAVPVLYAEETDEAVTGVMIINAPAPLPAGRLGVTGTCPGVPRTGITQPNIYGLNVLDLIGPDTKTITVTYYSGDWGGFGSVKELIETMLDIVPADISGYPFWGKAHSIRELGVAGTLEGPDGRKRPFELAHAIFLCFQDPSGAYRWTLLPKT